jgi:hypothetical protein
MEHSIYDGIKILCSIGQDVGKSIGAVLLFRFDPKSFIERAALVGCIAAMTDALLIDIFGIPYGFSMTVTFFVVIFAYWRVFQIRPSFGMLLGVTYAAMQSIVQRSVSAVWRTWIEPNADFVKDYTHVYPLMIWTFIAPIIIFGLLYRKGKGFDLMQQDLKLSKVHDLLIIIFASVYAVMYSSRSIFLPTSIWIVFAEPAFALIVLYAIQYKINRDHEEHYSNINATNYHL